MEILISSKSLARPPNPAPALSRYFSSPHFFPCDHCSLRLIFLQSNPNPVTGNPVPDTGAGHLVAAGLAGFALHDHDRIDRTPNPAKAFANYTFATRVKVTKAVIVQHNNGADQIELFSDSKSCGFSRGKARTDGQITGPGNTLQEQVLYDYTFAADCPPSTGISSPITSYMPPITRS